MCREHVAPAETPRGVQHLGVGEQVGVRKHRSLRLSGGAGGVEQRREIAGPARDGVESAGHRAARLHQGAVVVRAERERLTCSSAFAELRECIHRLGPHHDHLRLGVAEKIVQLALRVGRVEGQVGGARTQAREVENERSRRLLHLHRNAVAGRDTPLDHQVGVAGRLGLHIGERPNLATRGLQAGRRTVGGEARFQA